MVITHLVLKIPDEVGSVMFILRNWRQRLRAEMSRLAGSHRVGFEPHLV